MVGVNSLEHVSVSAVSRSGWTAAAEWLLPGSCTLNAAVCPEAGYEERKEMLKIYLTAKQSRKVQRKALLVKGTDTCQPLPCSMQIFGLPACRQIGQNTGLPWGEKYHTFRDS